MSLSFLTSPTRSSSLLLLTTPIRISPTIPIQIISGAYVVVVDLAVADHVAVDHAAQADHPAVEVEQAEAHIP